MKYILAIILITLLAPRALASIDYSPEGRYKAAAAHYTTGCYFTAMRICSGLWPIGPNNRYTCYAFNTIQCELDGEAYFKWMSQK